MDSSKEVFRGNGFLCATRRIPMDSGSSASHDGAMHRSMLVCCGAMLVIFGAFAVSSVATVIGLTTGQTYLAIAGFMIASVATLTYLYKRMQRNEESAVLAEEEAV